MLKQKRSADRAESGTIGGVSDTAWTDDHFSRAIGHHPAVQQLDSPTSRLQRRSVAPSGWCASLTLTQLKREIVIFVFCSFDLSEAILTGYFDSRTQKIQ